MFGKLFGLGGDDKAHQQTQRPPGPMGGGQPLPGSRGPPSAVAPAAAPKPTETGGGGGFFNLPAPVSAPAPGSRGGFGPGAPAPAASGADIFGSLSVKSTDAGAPAASGFGNFGASGSGASSSASGVPAVSGFNFMASAAAPAPAAAPELPAATGFGFISGGAAPAPAVASAFTFGAGMQQQDGSSGASGAAAVPGTGSAATAAVPAASAGGFVPPTNISVQASNVKKKKPTFRPGMDRAAFGADGAGGGGGGGSLLSGLTVHDDGGEEGGEHSAAAAASGMPGGSILAGLQLHADGEEGDGAGAGGGAPAPSFLSGLQVHDATGSSGSTGNTPQASGFGFVTASPAATATPTAPAVPVASGFPSSASSATATSGGPGAYGLPAATAASSDDESGFSALLRQRGGSGSGTVPVPGASGSSSSSSASGSGSGSGSGAGSGRSSSPTSRMRGVLSDLNEAARRSRMRLADLKIRIRQLVEQDRVIAAEIDKLKDKLGMLEAKQDECIKNEQFEEAEALNESLDSVRGSLAVAENKRRSVAEQRSKYEGEREAAFADSLGVTSDAVMGLRRYHDDRSTALTTFVRDADARHHGSADRISNDLEQLRLKEEHVELENKLVKDEQNQVERAIQEQTEELTTTVTTLRAKHASLTEEVAELERLLETKRREERMAASQLQDAEARIRNIHAKFDKQTKRVQAKRAAVDNEKAECAAEAAAIAKAKRDFAVTKRKDRLVEKNYLRQLQHNENELAIAEALRSALVEQSERRRGLSAQASAAAGVGNRASEEIERCLRSLRATQTRKATLEAQAAGLKKTIQVIDSKIPALNEEKKSAVSGKKFKEAGRLNDELKRLADEREAADKEMSSCTSGIDAAEQEVAAQEAELKRLRAAAGETEKAADLARIDLLRDAVRACRRGIRRIGRPRPLPEVDLTLAPDAEEYAEAVGAPASEDRDPDEEQLGIEREAGTGVSAAQTAAIEMLSAERDVLLDELTALTMKHGSGVELGPETDSDTEATALPATSSGSASKGKGKARSASTGSTGDRAAAAAAAVTILPAATTSGSDLTVFAAASPAAAEAAVSPAAAAVEEEVAPEEEAVVGADDILREFASTAAAATLDVGGFSFLGSGAATVAAAEAAPEPAAAPAAADISPEAAAAARAAELSDIARALLSCEAAVAEKGAIIEEAVGREDYDTADAAQADIDSMLDHKQRLLARAAELGVTSAEELAPFASGEVPSAADADGPASLLAGLSIASPSAAADVPTVSDLPFISAGATSPAASAFPFAAAATSPVAAEASALPWLSGATASSATAAPLASGLPFMSSAVDADSSTPPAADAANGAAPAATGFSFLS